jgi:hypothetical protein
VAAIDLVVSIGAEAEILSTLSEGAADLQHGDETVIFADTGYLGNEKRDGIQGGFD